MIVHSSPRASSVWSGSKMPSRIRHSALDAISFYIQQGCNVFETHLFHGIFSRCAAAQGAAAK